MIKVRTSSIALMIASASSALSTQRAAADPADESSHSTWQFTARSPRRATRTPMRSMRRINFEIGLARRSAQREGGCAPFNI